MPFTVARAEAAPPAPSPIVADGVPADCAGRASAERAVSAAMRLPVRLLSGAAAPIAPCRVYYPAAASLADGHGSAASRRSRNRSEPAARILLARSRRSTNGDLRAGRSRRVRRPGAAEQARACQPSPSFDPAQAARPPAAHRLGAAARRARAPASLASGGTLGGSQAGARADLCIRPSHRGVAAHQLAGRRQPRRRSRGRRPLHAVPLDPGRAHRRAAPGDRRSAAGAIGLRPVRRGRRLPAADAVDFALDAYAQAGVVGVRSRDLFADGGVTFTRPVFGRFSARLRRLGRRPAGLYRVDAGPRVSMRVRNNVARPPRLAPAPRRQWRSRARARRSRSAADF